MCAVGMTHNPRIFYTRSPPKNDVKNRVLEIFTQLKKIRDETGPNLLIVVGNHHLTTFLEIIPSFSIGFSEYAEGPTSFEVEAGIPHYKCRVDVNAAEHLIWQSLENEFDVARVFEFVLDHAFTIPLTFVAPSMDIPIIPVITNVHLPPIPNPVRFFKLGQVIRRAVETFDENKKVGIIASFNLSLNVGNEKMGVYDRSFDLYVTNFIEKGKLEELVTEISLSRLYNAGNASVELLNLFTLFGAIGNKEPCICFNEIVEGWGTISAVGWRFV